MDTLKTAVVVVLLLAVLYGVYVVLNKPEQYPQELAWETGTTDPALQIELGVPETTGYGSAATEVGAPTSAWGSGPASHATSTDPHASHLVEPQSSIEQNTATRPSLDANSFADRPSLPIPEATSPAAPAIAAPDLISSSESPTASVSDVSALDVDQVPSAATDPSAVALPGNANALRESADAATSYEPVANRYSDSNRYSEYSPLRNEASSAVVADQGTTAPANSTQANVNDSPSGDSYQGDGIGGVKVASVGGNTFQAAMDSVHTKIEAEAWYDALVKLSSHYSDTNLRADEFSQVIDLLDPLAGKVIYSTEHLIEPAYQPQAGDTLMNIADRYEVPWQLLANINGIENPETLLAGRELKVVRGPFRAEVSLSRNELTLFVGKLYAGRFSISVGSDPAPLPGQYQINDKQPGRTYYAGNGQTIPIDDPNNPYGRVWLDLGNNLCIHGSSPNGASPGQGCIALTARDAGDIYGILSKGSGVLIVR